MKIQLTCPKCDTLIKQENIENAQSLTCPECDKNFQLKHFPNADAAELRQCPICEAAHLYIQKDFPKKIGISIVTLAGIITILWDHRYYIALILTAIIDFLIYQKCPNLTKCYLCKTEFRGYTPIEKREGFDLNIHERYRKKEWPV